MPVGQCATERELSIGWQQAEGIEASAERSYRPEVTLICREDLIGVVTISKDGVQRIWSENKTSAGQAAAADGASAPAARLAAVSGGCG
jgi:hypothetical protein